MRSIAQAVILLWGWRRSGTAFLAGALSALSQAPVHAAPILFITIPILVFLLDGAVSPGRRRIRRLRPAAVVGWWFGFGYFLAGLYWIGAAFLVDADEFGWLMPFAVVALPAGLAIFFALGTAFACLLWVDGPLRILSLALGLTLAEWLRGHLFTGFPWNLIGQAVAFTDVTAQAVSVVGVYGLTALGLVVFAAPALLMEDIKSDRRQRALILGLCGLLVVADVGYGTIRLRNAGEEDAGIGGVRVRIVQPNINQAQKWSPEFRQSTLDTLAELSDLKTETEPLGLMGISHVIWPETALPFFLTEEPQALAALDTLLPPGATLITGAPRMERTSEGRRFYNSVYVIDDGGRILSAYDKVHLVPFGEYLPFESVLRAVGLSELTKQIGGFSSGPGLQTISIPGGLRAGFLVCYEVIFPSKVVDPQDRPDFIVNLTNDGWFGLTSGPYQHLDQARMRAIEEGLPVVRATNTGISAVIDAYGRITGSIPLGQAGVLDAVVPAMRPIVLFPLINAYFLLTWSVISVMVATTAWGKLKRPR